MLAKLHWNNYTKSITNPFLRELRSEMLHMKIVQNTWISLTKTFNKINSKSLWKAFPTENKCYCQSMKCSV